MSTTRESLGGCEACKRETFEGDDYHSGHDCIMCVECAPTYQDMINEPEFYFDHNTDEPLTAEEAQDLAAQHVSKGGSLTDKMLS